MEGGVLLESQASERVRMSKFWSEINSCRTAGLSRSGVIVVADLILRCEMLRVLELSAVDIGPGLSSISPASRSRQKVKIKVFLVMEKLENDLDDVLKIKKPTGKESRHLQM